MSSTSFYRQIQLISENRDSENNLKEKLNIHKKDSEIWALI